MQNLQISKHVHSQIKSAFLNGDEFFYLYALFLEEDWEIQLPIESINKLKTLGYIDKKTGFLASIGYDFILSLTEQNEIDYTQDFDDFWAIYPPSDAWGKYPHSRNIRTNKDESFSEYKKQRLYRSHEEIKTGLINYIAHLKDISVASNSLRFMKGPLNFLKERIYLEFPTKNSKTISYGNDLA